MIKRTGAVLLGAVALAAIVLTASAANADTVTWNTCAATCVGGLTPSSVSSAGSGVDRVLTFTATGGQQLIAEAFRTQNSISLYGVIDKTSIAIFTGGLGAGGESSPQHAVDNVGPDEFIIFKFAQDTYVPLSFKLGYVNSDSDVVTYIGGAGDSFLAALQAGTFNWDTFIGNPGAMGFVSQTFLDVPVGASQSFSNNASGRYLIIGARNETDSCGTGCLSDGGEDEFKIEQIVGEVGVPEPGTLLLLGVGLAGLAGFARRRS